MGIKTCRILGLDPGLQNTGWGVIDCSGSSFAFVAAGIIHSAPDKTLAERLAELHTGVAAVVSEFNPEETAIEETFVNKNPNSTLKLGQARGAIILVPALQKIPVFEYAPNQIKKMVVGSGHAEKRQVDMMVHTMLKGVQNYKIGPDAADALAIAMCHGYMRTSVIRNLS